MIDVDNVTQTNALHIHYHKICKYCALSDDQIRDINVLLSQLSTKAILRSRSWIEEVARNEVFVVAICPNGNTGHHQIVGMALLCTIKNLCAGNMGYIHEVVVHTDFRRRGIMSQLMVELHERAKMMRLDAIELTSDSRNEDRRKAIQGYLKMGYRQKQTDVFVYQLRDREISL